MIIKNRTEHNCEKVAHIATGIFSKAACYLTVCLTKLTRLGVLVVEL